MDALMLMNTAGSDALTDISAQLSEVLSRARAADGVIAYVQAPAPAAAPEAVAGSESSPAPEAVAGLGQTEDDLSLTSEVADAFDGIDDLAAGLHDLSVDRIILGGVDVERSVFHTAMAALACNFDVVVLSDAVIAAEAQPVDWVEPAAAEGAVVSAARDTWLRM